jgi:hypothetical protein
MPPYSYSRRTSSSGGGCTSSGSSSDDIGSGSGSGDGSGGSGGSADASHSRSRSARALAVAEAAETVAEQTSQRIRASFYLQRHLESSLQQAGADGVPAGPGGASNTEELAAASQRHQAYLREQLVGLLRAERPPGSCGPVASASAEAAPDATSAAAVGAWPQRGGGGSDGALPPSLSRGRGDGLSFGVDSLSVSTLGAGG